jgi:ribosomal-protein-serine acetyltransferase
LQPLKRLCRLGKQIMIQPLRLDIPSEITTERLLLRTPRSGEGTLIISSVLTSLAELKPWLPWVTDAYSVDDAEDWCRRTASNFLLGEEAGYLILDRQSARYLGAISCRVESKSVPKCEIGYWLSTREVGHGYMTEALRAVTEMGFNSISARRIQIRADEDNHRSRRVAERAGYALEGILKNYNADSTGRLFNDCMYAKINDAR